MSACHSSRQHSWGGREVEWKHRVCLSQSNVILGTVRPTRDLIRILVLFIDYFISIVESVVVFGREGIVVERVVVVLLSHKPITTSNNQNKMGKA